MIFVAVASIAVAIVRFLQADSLIELTFLQLSVFTGKGGDSSQNLRLNVGCAYGFTVAQ